VHQETSSTRIFDVWFAGWIHRDDLAIVVEPPENNVGNVLVEIVGVEMNIRQQRVEVDQRSRLQFVHHCDIVPFGATA